jgi:hypothetical protein
VTAPTQIFGEWSKEDAKNDAESDDKYLSG